MRKTVSPAHLFTLTSLGIPRACVSAGEYGVAFSTTERQEQMAGLGWEQIGLSPKNTAFGYQPLPLPLGFRLLLSQAPVGHPQPRPDAVPCPRAMVDLRPTPCCFQIAYFDPEVGLFFSQK